MAEVLRDWKSVSLDGCAVAAARVTGPREIELSGVWNVIKTSGYCMIGGWINMVADSRVVELEKLIWRFGIEAGDQAESAWIPFDEGRRLKLIDKLSNREWLQSASWTYRVTI